MSPSIKRTRNTYDELFTIKMESASPLISTDANYIHKFGFEFSKKLLGTQTINDAVRQHCDRIHNGHFKKLPDFPCEGFRANWRSGVHYPWELSSPSRANQSPTDGLGGDSIVVSPATLFVDVTFDFLLFPYNLSGETEGMQCHVYQLERSQNIHDNNSLGRNKGKDTATFGIAVAIRIGALLATFTGNEHGNEQFRYHYLQGNPLSAVDVHEHCRAVDVDPNFTDASQVADLIAKSLLREERCKLTTDCGIIDEKTDVDSFWQVRAVQEDSVQNPVSNFTYSKDDSKKTWRWEVKLYHNTLNMAGMFTFHHQTCDDNEPFDSVSPEATLFFGDPIGRQTLDMLLLHTAGDGCGGGKCVPTEFKEIRRSWSLIHPSLLEYLRETGPPSITESLLYSHTIPTITWQPDSAYHERQSTQCGDSASENQATKPGQWSQSSKSSDDKPILKRSSSKSSSSSRSQQETGVFARATKTSILGSKRKKKKLTLGDI